MNIYTILVNPLTLWLALMIAFWIFNFVLEQREMRSRERQAEQIMRHMNER